MALSETSRRLRRSAITCSSSSGSSSSLSSRIASVRSRRRMRVDCTRRPAVAREKARAVATRLRLRPSAKCNRRTTRSSASSVRNASRNACRKLRPEPFAKPRVVGVALKLWGVGSEGLVPGFGPARRVECLKRFGSRRPGAIPTADPVPILEESSAGARLRAPAGGFARAAAAASHAGHPGPCATRGAAGHHPALPHLLRDLRRHPQRATQADRGGAPVNRRWDTLVTIGAQAGAQPAASPPPPPTTPRPRPGRSPMEYLVTMTTHVPDGTPDGRGRGHPSP